MWGFSGKSCHFSNILNFPGLLGNYQKLDFWTLRNQIHLILNQFSEIKYLLLRIRIVNTHTPPSPFIRFYHSLCAVPLVAVHN